MKIGIPIDEDKGLLSQICLHFGKAPKFLVVNTQTKKFNVINNGDTATASRQSSVVALLSAQKVSSVVVGGIGLGALDTLQSAGIAVYSSAKDTVDEIVEEVNAGSINPVTLGNSCSHKRRGGRGFNGPSGCSGSHGQGGCHGAG